MFNINKLSHALAVDTLYESAQKRTFVSSILLAGVHIPFLIEIIVLYRQLGPKLDKHIRSPP